MYARVGGGGATLVYSYIYLHEFAADFFMKLHSFTKFGMINRYMKLFFVLTKGTENCNLRARSLLVSLDTSCGNFL